MALHSFLSALPGFLFSIPLSAAKWKEELQKAMVLDFGEAVWEGPGDGDGGSDAVKMSGSAGVS